MKTILTTLNAKFIHTSLALRYLKAFAQPEFDIEITEYTIKDPTMNIVSDLYARKPDIIGFSCYIWNIEETIKIIQILKKITPSTTIVLGGPEVTYDTKEWMEKIPEVDCIVIGEGEKTFKDLLTAIESGNSLETVDGIFYRDKGEVHFRPQRGKLELKDIPTPYRFQEDIDNLSKRIVYIETSRGCPFSCQFCLSSIEVGVRYFDKEKIKEDILYLMENGAKTIKFVDRTFNISRSYAMDMFSFLIENFKPGTVFQFEITADIMRPEVITYLNENAPPGLFRFEIGVQSTNDYTNELVKRKQNFKKLTRTVQMVKDGGKIVQHLDLIAGLPEEEYSSFRKTFNDVFAFEPEELQLGFLKMLRGTGLRINAKEYGYVYMDHSPYEMLKNNVLSFDEIIKIKQVEDVLEKYWNDHRMDETVRFLIQREFPSAFDFFQAFGAYWEEQGWGKIGHQLEDLFKRLNQFLQHLSLEKMSIVTSLMKYDYLKSKNHKPRTSWWEDKEDKATRSHFLKLIEENPSLLGEQFNRLQLTEKDLHKHTILEILPFDIEEYMKNGSIIMAETILLVFYNPQEKESSVFTVQKHLLQNKNAS